MKMKNVIIAAVVMLAGNMSGTDGVELLKKHEGIDSVSVTTTNLTIWFNENKSRGLSVLDKPIRGMARSSSEYAEKNEPLVLAPDDSITLIYQYNCVVKITPVTFKKQRRGFEISDIVAAHYGEKDLINAAYIVLSDKPIQVNEEDVEMIMKDGEWKTVKEYHATVERENRLQELRFKYRDKRREAEALLQGEELTNRLSAIEHEVKLERERIESGTQTEDEPSEEKSKTTTFWLYALIPLCLLAVLWLARKKRKRDSP